MRKTCLKIGGGQRFEFGGQRKLYHHLKPPILMCKNNCLSMLLPSPTATVCQWPGSSRCSYPTSTTWRPQPETFVITTSTSTQRSTLKPSESLITPCTALQNLNCGSSESTNLNSYLICYHDRDSALAAGRQAGPGPQAS